MGNDLREALERAKQAFEDIGRAVAEAWRKMLREIKRLNIKNAKAKRAIECRKWREAALLAGQRAQARAQAYDRQMQLEKARRAMRRRKRLHDDGGLPDW